MTAASTAAIAQRRRTALRSRWGRRRGREIFRRNFHSQAVSVGRRGRDDRAYDPGAGRSGRHRWGWWKIVGIVP